VAEPELRVVSTDAERRGSVLGALEEAARTILRRRPSSPDILVAEDDERLRRALERVLAAIRRWTWVAPLMLSVVCGISLLAVNMVGSIERVLEFGVQRGAGARRQDIVHQLVAEVALITSLGLIPLLWVALGVLAAGAAIPLRAIALPVTLGAATMLVLTGTGVLLPGYAAVKRADISALERAGL
jgi:hypothetical protein